MNSHVTYLMAQQRSSEFVQAAEKSRREHVEHLSPQAQISVVDLLAPRAVARLWHRSRAARQSPQTHRA